MKHIVPFLSVGYLIDRSANCRDILVGFSSLIPSFFLMDNIIKLTLSPMLLKDRLRFMLPLTQGMILPLFAQNLVSISSTEQLLTKGSI